VRVVADPTTGQFLFGFVLAAVVGGAVWIHADKHGSKHPTAWGISVTLFLAIALPIYLIRNHRRRRRGNV
jgi:biotin transporter BioY